MKPNPGRIIGAMRYDLLPALMLNELQKLEKENQRIAAENRRKEKELAAMAIRLAALEREVHATQTAARDPR